MRPLFALVSLCLSAGVLPAAAKEATVLPTVEVTPGAQAVTLPGIAAARDAIAAVPGGAGVVDTETVREGRTSNLVDTLAFAPGVFIASRFGAEEARLSIRGSGLQRTFHMRGLSLLQDGVPLNFADGSVDFQAVEPLASRYVEVWRGANALQYGAASLGGAVNFVSPSGLDQPGLGVRAEAGSFGYARAQAEYAGAADALDGVASLAAFHQDGFRDHARQDAQRFFANLGWRVSPQVETRFFVAVVNTDSELPGALTRAEMLANPRKADPAAVKGDQHRDFDLYRFSNLTRVGLGEAEDLELGASYAIKHLFHPIYQVLEQDSGTGGLDLRYQNTRPWLGADNRFVIGTTLLQGTLDDDRFVNIDGRPGARTGQSQQRAGTYTAFAEWQHEILPATHGVLGGQFTRATRELEDRYFADGVDNSFDRTYQQFSPRLGLLYALSESIQFFGNWSRSFEPPSFGELAGGPNVTQVDAQRADTVEVGARGRWVGGSSQLQWDLALYRASVRDELLALNDARGNPLGSVNADRTTHQGVELGLEARWLTHWQVRTSVLFNDFRFDGDPVYGDKRLAGVPERTAILELHYVTPSGFYCGPNLRAASGSWVDHANTLRAAGYGLLGFKLGQRRSGELSWFIEGRNLLDRTHAATTGVVADARGMDLRQFYPGDGASVYAGIESHF